MRVLVTGGAGYIGSVIAARLATHGHQVTVYDDLSRGHAAAVPEGATLIRGDVREEEALTRTLQDVGARAIVHMAALAEVAESMAHPERYAEVNVAGTASLLRAARVAGVDRLVFSSTAAIYGDPGHVPIVEDDPPAPTNPYGETKLAAERLLRDAVPDVATVALRYFNACGADAGLGEDHDPETHLVPLALRAAADGTPFRIFGDDYPTADGTCVRDYVHVADLAEAHVLALERLPDLPPALNLGTGTGDSVLAVLDAVERVTGRALRRVAAPRRPGAPPGRGAPPPARRPSGARRRQRPRATGAGLVAAPLTERRGARCLGVDAGASPRVRSGPDTVGSRTAHETAAPDGGRHLPRPATALSRRASRPSRPSRSRA